MSEREVMSAKEVARFLRRRDQDVLDDIAAGRIPSVAIGARRRVLRSSLLEMLRRDERRAGPAGVSISAFPGVSYDRKRREPSGAGRGPA